MDTNIKQNGRDAAWATIHTSCTTKELMYFFQDIERLFRINPMLHFVCWQRLSDNEYRFCGQNLSQDKPFDFDVLLTVTTLDQGIQIDYRGDLKSRTTFLIETAADAPAQTRLTITDYYDGLPEAERRQKLHRVDKSIKVWATDLQRYLYHWKKWSHARPWCWYMQHIWQPMKPSGRRIVYMLCWITLFELAFILLAAAIHYLER